MIDNSFSLNFESDFYIIRLLSFNNESVFSIEYDYTAYPALSPHHINPKQILKMFFSFKEENINENDFQTDFFSSRDKIINKDQFQSYFLSKKELYISKFLDFFNEIQKFKLSLIHHRIKKIHEINIDLIFKHSLYSNGLLKYINYSRLFKNDDLLILCSISNHAFSYLFNHLFCEESFFSEHSNDTFFFNNETISFYDFIFMNKNNIKKLDCLISQENIIFYNYLSLIDKMHMNSLELFSLFLKKYKDFEERDFDFFNTYFSDIFYHYAFQFSEKIKIQELTFKYGFIVNTDSVDLEEFLDNIININFDEYITSLDNTIHSINYLLTEFFLTISDINSFTENDVFLLYPFVEQLLSTLSNSQLIEIQESDEWIALFSQFDFECFSLLFNRYLLQLNIESF